MHRPLACVLSMLCLSVACTADDAATTTAAATANADTANAEATGATGADAGDTMPAGDGVGPLDSSGAADDGVVGEAGCCVRHPDAGCNEPAVAQCVCAADATCCTFEWDDNCVNAARNDCDATCQAADDGAVDGLDTAGDVVDTGAADTAGGVTDGMGDVMDTGSVGSDACCMATMTPGCSDGALEACVCGDDPFCCEMEWDFQCTMEVAACGADCGGAGDGMASTDCCTPHMMSGCDDMTAESCVCELDPFCCNQAWDEQCVDEATIECTAGC